MKSAATTLKSFIVLLIIISIATGFVESIMGPRVAFPVVIKRFSGKKYELLRSPSKNVFKSYAKLPSTKVVTDIDDTVKSSGGVKLFGIPLGGVDVSSKRNSQDNTPVSNQANFASFDLDNRCFVCRPNSVGESSTPEHSSLLSSCHQD